MGRLYRVTIDIEGESALSNFEVIEIVDDKNTYPVLIGIDWAFDMDAVINLKKWRITFEKKVLWVIVMLDPIEGVHYTEPIHDYEEEDILDQIYKITAHDEDWINPTTDGWITWDRDNSYTSYSDEQIEH